MYIFQQFKDLFNGIIYNYKIGNTSINNSTVKNNINTITKYFYLIKSLIENHLDTEVAIYYNIIVTLLNQYLLIYGILLVIILVGILITILILKHKIDKKLTNAMPSILSIYESLPYNIVLKNQSTYFKLQAIIDDK